MAKEMMIMFVYDTQIVKKEEDDPVSAILYFHPTWVSDQQKTALCGQIMGTVQCLKALFDCPRIVSLQSGKFSITQYGRYILAVGTDRNVDDWVLEYRSDILSSLITFFHYDLDALAQLYQSSSILSAKLYHMFETYLKMLTYGGNMFSNIPMIQLPKSASNVFLEATHILQSCQSVNHVLGGTMLYHNKVVATQLPSDLTKLLILTDPYRIKSPAEVAVVDFQLPLGVQLLQVYVNGKEYRSLRREATRNRNVFQYLSRKSIKKIPNKSAAIKEQVISTMKRDQSLLFTAVPEEDSSYQSPVNIESTFITMKPQNRPKFLNLRNKTTDVKSEDKVDCPNYPCTPFNGQTSVCSTPMTELKKIVHSAAVSICTNPLENNNQSVNNSFRTDSVNSLLSALSEKSDSFILNGADKANKNAPYIDIHKNLYDNKKSRSVQNIKDKLKTISKHVTVRYYGIGLPRLSKNMENETKTPAFDPEENMQSYKTIADPTFPVFRSDGKMISKTLYHNFLSKHLTQISNEFRNSLQNKADEDEWKSLENFDSCSSDFQRKENDTKTVVIGETSKTSEKKVKIESTNKKLRKALSLPLKSLSSDSDNAAVKHHGGVQLTPLMSKLSILVAEDKSSGFYSRETTPSEYKDFIYTPLQPNYTFLSKKDDSENQQSEDAEDCLQKCVLFICGQQDMVVGMLLENNAASNPDVINKLWEICTECLGKLEKQLRHCLEMCHGSASQNEVEPYSYLCMDPDWDTVQRGGPWNGIELGTLTHLHRDFINANNLTEIILRDDDSVIYGHHCGSTEVFYHQTVSSNAGLPTPADPMGIVPLKARRRLERDHAIILF